MNSRLKIYNKCLHFKVIESPVGKRLEVEPTEFDNFLI